jgi:hypothetical protein
MTRTGRERARLAWAGTDSARNRPGIKRRAGGSGKSMADSETDSRETAAQLRITRVRALDHHDLVAVVTYLLANYPDTFPAMLDDALSAASPKQAG